MATAEHEALFDFCASLDDPFVTPWCYDKVDAFGLEEKSAVPQIGTYALEEDLKMNHTRPLSMDGRQSKIRLCLEAGDANSCQCNV